MTQPAAPERRRLEQETGARKLPIGCMAWGGVLGIIVGIMVALYALPPILRSIYGEEHVGSGEVYEKDGRRIAVIGGGRDGGVITISLQVRSNQAWTMSEEDWQLEISTQEDWLPALPADPAIPDTSFALELATERTLILRFTAPEGVDTRAVELHLANPRVGFALQPE